MDEGFVVEGEAELFDVRELFELFDGGVGELDFRVVGFVPGESLGEGDGRSFGRDARGFDVWHGGVCRG